MRLRQQEQKHLHTLTVQKIEAIAQHCLAQESQIQTLLSQARSLRSENQTLAQHNTRLTSDISLLRREQEFKEATMTAMTGAVAGLEGWIESTATPTKQYTPIKHIQSNHQPNSRTPHNQHNPALSPSHSPLRPSTTTNTTPQPPPSQRSILKGRGRFRGRHYFIDGPLPTSISNPTSTYNNHNPHQNEDIQTQLQYTTHDIHDGVKAWIRGFRDVEEYASCGTMPYSREGEVRRESGMGMEVEGKGERVDEDWGDFERAG